MIFFCLVAPAQSGTAVNDGQEDVLPDPCARDPIYREFEMIQVDAYLSNKDFRIFLESDLRNRVKQSVFKELRDRAFAQTGVIIVTQEFERYFEAEVASLKVPTCYENPFFYLMMDQYARDVETARQELGLSLAVRPRFGSLPSNDINAYTYPLSGGRAHVIAINSQLFNFIYQMTALSVHGVDPALNKRQLSQAEVITNGLIGIAYNPQAQKSFVASIVGLLLGKPIARGPVSHLEEPLVIFFAAAMERFVFAHEYGHLIRTHRSPKTSRPTGATGSFEYDVLKWSWRQEFEADSVGLKLVIQILLRSAQDNPSLTAYYIYALKAPLFFFECEELLDQARYMQETGKMPPPLTDKDKSFVRNCANGTILKADRKRCVNDILNNHPPAWLREERLQRPINDALARLPGNEATAEAAQKGSEMLFSVDFFWRETSAQILTALTEQEKLIRQ